MNTFWRRLTSFFNGKCLYYDNCALYQLDSWACNKDMGYRCGACRIFDEQGDQCIHYCDQTTVMNGYKRGDRLEKCPKCGRYTSDGTKCLAKNCN